MKPAAIRELSDAQPVEKLTEMRAELFNLRFQMATSQLDNTDVYKRQALRRVQLACCRDRFRSWRTL